jgi:hypothetical protein
MRNRNPSKLCPKIHNPHRPTQHRIPRPNDQNRRCPTRRRGLHHRNLPRRRALGRRDAATRRIDAQSPIRPTSDHLAQTRRKGFHEIGKHVSVSSVQDECATRDVVYYRTFGMFEKWAFFWERRIFYSGGTID